MSINVASAAEANLANNGAAVLARVSDSNRATDLALSLAPTRLAVVRCVEHATKDDHSTLATMLNEGDFNWAALVYSEGDGSVPLGSIESFHVSQLDQLVARLLELREASGEAG